MNNAHIGLSNLWTNILTGEKIDESALDGKQRPCPLCGGKDRFRFDDKGEGRWYCNHCGSGDGYTLLMGKLGINFKAAKVVADKYSGQTPLRRAKQPLSDKAKRDLMNKVWSGASQESLELNDYLTGRGINEQLFFNHTIRWHKGLKCSAVDAVAPAILIKCYRWSIDGKPEPATIQRHWPSLGKKMMMPAPIKLDGIFCPIGGRPVNGVMGVCEGYITAMSVMAMQNEQNRHPVWATMSAEQMVKFVPPPEVKELVIYADVDRSFTGQAAAYGLAKRLRVSHPAITVTVRFPTQLQDVDYDYNDLLKDTVK